MTKQEFFLLIDKYLAGKASIEEEQLLLNFFDSFQSGTEWDENLFGVKQQLEDKMFRRLQAAMQEGAGSNKIRAISIFSFKNAAAVIIGFAITTGVIIFSQEKNIRQPALTTKTPAVKYDVQPGSNKAILTLADGSRLSLNAFKNGVLAKAGHISIKKTKDGQLRYLAGPVTNPDTDAPEIYNTITTPIGGQYQVILPDGTKVWLNSASSLKYPTLFKGRQRIVELMGEGYFEVAKNRMMPFKVKVNNMEINVVGTHFNIMAYDNEPAMKTTLLEGSVLLNEGAASSTLKPGQQGVVDKGGAIKVLDVNAEQAVAWKDGYFEFNRADIKTIMRQISRWYGVTVEYNGAVKNDEFVGRIERDAQLQEVLHMLQLSHVHFKTENKRIIVMP